MAPCFELVNVNLCLWSFIYFQLLPCWNLKMKLRTTWGLFLVFGFSSCCLKGGSWINRPRILCTGENFSVVYSNALQGLRNINIVSVEEDQNMLPAFLWIWTSLSFYLLVLLLRSFIVTNWDQMQKLYLWFSVCLAGWITTVLLVENVQLCTLLPDCGKCWGRESVSRVCCRAM